MTTPTSSSAAAVVQYHLEEVDDPLSEAMSMLDLLAADGSNKFDDFAIDSDDKGKDVDLDDLDLDDDGLLGLDSGIAGSSTPSINQVGDGGGGSLEDGTLWDNLQGRLSTDGSNIVSGAAAGTGAPPAHWATKQDVTNLSASNDSPYGGGDGAVNSTTATSLPNENHPLAHPLQDLGGGGSNDRGSTGSWTSSFATFASKATASVQSSVENAEAAVLQGATSGIARPDRRSWEVVTF